MALNVGRCMGQGRRSPLLHQKRARYSILHKGTKTGTALKTKSHCSLFKPPLSCEARGRNLHLPGTAVHRLLNESRYVQARVGLRWRLSQLDTSQWFLLLLNIPGGTTLSILVSLSCSFHSLRLKHLQHMDPSSPEAQAILQHSNVTYDEAIFYESHHQTGKYVSWLVLIHRTQGVSIY